ncbi:MAG: cell envelope integrity protein CreD [Treponema sp.]|jgi:inner membrane protein|nr:cell envelope integrity protein CreD [Treponema sp.]
MKAIKNITGTRGFKVFLLFVLMLLFLIPVSMIRGIIYERSYRSSKAEEEIMNSWGEEFVIQGPVLRIPAKEYERVTIKNDRGEEKIELREYDFSFWIAPETLNAGIHLGTEIKERGIFSVPLFAGKINLSGRFDPARVEKELKANQVFFPEQAELVIALASQRGIRGIEKALWNNTELAFLPGNRGFSAGHRQGGINAPAPMEKSGKYEFEISMAVQGGKSLHMVPLGEDSVFEMTADWAAPSFKGSYLPVQRSISEAGFDARWEVSHLSRNIPLVWTSSQVSDLDFSSALFGVNFFKVLDHYNVNTRAVKYALLFIIIPFLSFFLFEIITRRQIHPVQYILSGIGNVVFYLLLLSLSEHLAFSAAYLIAASAVSLMMTLYSRSLLGAWNRSWLMAVIMVLCYIFLYFTLQSEDWALLIGSIGCFGITGAVMFLTRKLDWYNTGRDKTETPEPPEPLTVDPV